MNDDDFQDNCKKVAHFIIVKGSTQSYSVR